MTQAPTMPASARALVAAVSVAGAAVLVHRLAGAGDLGWGDAAAVLLVAAAVVVGDRFTVEIPHGDDGGDSEHFSLADAVWTAALVLTAPGVPTIAAALGTASWQLVARWPLRKVAFNAGQVTLALAAAEAVWALGPERPDPLSPLTWLLAAAAMAAVLVVNYGSVALVISLVQGQPFHRILLDPWRINLIQWVGNVSVGLLAAVLWTLSPFGLVLLALPCLLLTLAYRAWVRSTIERNQMEQMMRGADLIARERAFEARLPVGEATGRLPELAASLNHMLDQLELAFHRQRQLMADVAEQLRSPLRSISRALGERQDDPAPDPVAAAALRADLARVTRILDDMADIGRSQLPGFVRARPVQVADVVEDIRAKAEPFLGERLRSQAPPASLVSLDRDRIGAALLRLLQNTADHAPGTRPVDLRAVEEDGSILFEVVDEGGGVPAGHEDAIFEPFYRAHPRQDGAGLGLALVRTVAEAHGGSAGVVNRPGAGVTFWLRVPR